MATIYFASDNTLSGRDGSLNNPYQHPGELPAPWAMAGGNDYKFHGDAPAFNFSKSWRLTAFTSSAITVSGYGSNTSKPIIQCYRMVAASECTEVMLNYTNGNPVMTTTPQSGTNHWRVPAEFFGLYGDNTWGVACDTTGTTVGGASVVPSSSREFTDLYTDSGLYRVVYSEGNPVEEYGGMFAANLVTGDATSTATNRCIYAVQAYGGLWVDGVEFDRVFGPTYMTAASPPFAQARMAANNVTNCVLRNSAHGFDWAGGDAASGFGQGRGFRNLRIYGNYGENLGRSFIDMAFNANGICLNDTRIYENVCNGFGKSTSTGGIYIAACYTTDDTRVLVERNCLSGGEYGHVWPADGYAFYSENSSRDIEWRLNFGWNNDLGFINNITSGEVVWRQNVSVVKDGIPTGNSRMFVVSGPTSTAKVLHQGNVAIGYRRFMLAVAGGTVGMLRVRSNVSLCPHSSGGIGSGTNTNALRFGGHDTAYMEVDGNNFYGHDTQVYDSFTGLGYSSAPEVTNSIGSDPSVQIAAHLPTPTNPQKNYALQISPNYWSGAVDLQGGAGSLA